MTFLKKRDKLEIKERQQRIASFNSGCWFPPASNDWVDKSEWAGAT